MNELVVCGDSFMSPRLNYAGKHFSEIVSSNMGLKLKAYSRSGISNGGIALQILEAITQNPKLILLNLTYHDRIEFRLDGFDPQLITFKSLWYDINNTDLSTLGGQSGPLASDNLVSLLSDSLIYPENKLKVIHQYFNELYCEEWKRQTDCMLMYSVLHTLHKTSIPYLVIQDNLLLHRSPCPIDWIAEKNNISEEMIPFFNRPKEFDPGFHTSFETQQEMAQYVLNHLDKYFD